MQNISEIKDSIARAFAVQHAAMVLEAYPDLLTAEPILAKFVALIKPTQEKRI